MECDVIIKKRRDWQITKGYNSIRRNKDISITEGDQYIKESLSTNPIASKRSTISS